MPTVETNDIETYYERHGEGRQLVCIHGAWTDHRLWNSQVDGLGTDYEIVVYDEGVRVLAAALLTFILPFGLAVSTATLYGIALVALLPLAALPFVGALYAVRRFENYTLE